MSLITDLSAITTIPISNLEKLKKKEELCILHKVFENEIRGEEVTYMDLGYGTLYIRHLDNELRYKFVPSKSFETNLKKTIKTQKSPLIEQAEQSINEKIFTIYKELF